MNKKTKQSARTLRLKTRQFSRFEDYEWGRCCKAYVGVCAKACRLPLHELAELSGFHPRSMEAFAERCHAFNTLEGRVPRKYLAAIGVDLDVLRQCAALDDSEYAAALRVAGLPRNYSEVSANSEVCREFPPYVTEIHQAIAYLWGLAERTPASSPSPVGLEIRWPHVKTLHIRCGKRPAIYVTGYRPRLLITPRFVTLEAADLAQEQSEYKPEKWLSKAMKKLGMPSKPTEEQIALIEPVTQLLDKYDHEGIVRMFEMNIPEWVQVTGWREYMPEAEHLCAMIDRWTSVRATARLVRDVFKEFFYHARDNERSQRVQTRIAQETMNLRSIYRGYNPTRFQSVRDPDLCSFVARCIEIP